MPFARSELSSTVRARLAADLPMLAARNALARSVRPPEWRTSGSWTTGQDLTVRGFPTAAAIDWHHHALTRPRANGVGLVMFLLFELADETFDTAAILQHNASALTGVVSWRIDIADDPTFTTNLETIASWSTSLSRRLVSVTLGAGNPGVLVGSVYSSVRYVRVRVAYAGTAPHPELGEVLLLRRQALPYRPDVPHDDEGEESLTQGLEANSGDEHTVTRYRGRHVLDASFEPDTDADIAQWRAWHADCAHGTEPWLWIPRPASDVRRAYVMRQRAGGLAIPVVGNPTNGRMRLVALEQGPFYAREIAA